MKTYLFFSLLYLTTILVKAQSLINTNQIYIGVERSIGSNSVFGPLAAAKYELTYTRFLGSGKLSIENTLGFIDHYRKEQLAPYNFTYLSDRSQRMSLDATLLFRVINVPRHRFRVGLGPTVWYQKNGFARDETVLLKPRGTEVNGVTFKVVNQNQFVLGVNLIGTYDFALNPSFIIGLKGALLGSILSTKTEIGTLNNSMSTAGIRIGYNF